MLVRVGDTLGVGVPVRVGVALGVLVALGGLVGLSVALGVGVPVRVGVVGPQNEKLEFESEYLIDASGQDAFLALTLVSLEFAATGAEIDKEELENEQIIAG